MTQVGFIGAGNMAFALAGAIASKGLAGTFHVFDIAKDRLDLFSRELQGVKVEKSNRDVVAGADVVFLAVKPQVIDSVLSELGGCTGVVVSIAAGVTLRRLESHLPEARVFRVMPNTPCLVGEMAAGFAAGTRVTAADRNVVENLLQAAGIAIEVPEDLLDSVTGLSGSGPAFFARIIEAFIEAGMHNGLAAETARDLVLKTAIGTARLLMERDMTPQQLVDMVSSPGGTTIAGRAVLEQSDLREIILRTVSAAAQRSRELGS